MSKSNHPIEQEELMAYLDGELATNRAVAAAAHLEHCAECQELAADLRKLSQELMAWEVEQSESSSEISDEIVAALENRKKEPKKRSASAGWSWGMLFTPSRLAMAGGVVVLFLLVMAMSIPNLLRSSYSANKSARMARERAASQAQTPQSGPVLSDTYSSGGVPPPPPKMLTQSRGIGALGKMEETGQKDDEIDSSERTLDLPTVPMIARTAGLTLTTKEFDKTRATLEEILKRHNGYMGELKVSAPADAGRTLTATLRIPVQQFEAAMAELKKLGRVEDESQGGEEVTQQYVDLQARLANGIHTEQRLTEILRQRTGKLQDVLKVELEIDRVRGEIEQMQAEKKELSKRVAFATLNTTVKEEYFAKLQGTPPSTGSRFRNAAVDGYNTVVEGLIDVGLFLLSAGPSLLLWAAILFFPVRWAWKKLRRRIAEPDIPSTS
jgi:multisubunit Na+/H+ antiporter MnhB subunit